MGDEENQERRSNLGLRAAITNARQTHEKEASRRARELFGEMGIIKAVIAAIEQGDSVATIPFPKKLQSIAPTDLYSGEITWANVIKRFCSLVEAEDVQATANLQPGRGGCCNSPSRDFGQGPPQRCKGGHSLKAHNENTFHDVSLKF